MNKMFLLLKMMRASNEGMTTTKSKSQVLGYFIYFLLLFFSFVIFGPLTFAMYHVLSPLGLADLIIGLSIVGGSILIFLYSFSNILSVFYFSQDIEYLLPLPLQPYQILYAKFLTTLSQQYIAQSLLLLPIWIVYGVASGASVIYYLTFVVMFMALPILPMMISSILVMILMQFTSLSRNKDRSKLIAGLIGICFALFFNIAIRSNHGNTENVLLTEGNRSVMEGIVEFFPPARFGTGALANSGTVNGFFNLCIFLLIAAISVVLLGLIGHKLYLKGVMDGSSTKSKGRRVKQKIEGTKQKGKLTSYVMKEIRLVLRTPTFFLNCVINNIYTPIIFIVIFGMNSGGEGDSALSFIQGDNGLALFLAGGLPFIMVFAGGGTNSLTAVSRDGQSWYINKYLPVDPKVIIYGKIVAAWIMNCIVPILFIIPLVLFLHVPVYIVLLWLILCFMGMFIDTSLGVIADLKAPNVVWDTEQQLFKGRSTVLLQMIFAAMGYGTLFACNLIIIYVLNWNSLVVFLFTAIVLGIALYVVRKYADKQIVKHF